MQRSREMERAEKRLSGKEGNDAKNRASIEENLRKEMRRLDREVAEVVMVKEKKVAEMMRDGNRQMRRADEKEQKIAQKIYWIVIDKAENLDERSSEGGDEEPEN
ncbi:hypothetical protein G7Y89_g11063 [Cudoniella acicularis]|uniref:Uncharacterized protein n=1 Tax=Cudoniella acicularis TaxID=354080 RepID=A0A8H4RBI8_9HELO|nr:hypothetical protein G7Y89_g11063 [Cudoniella acicularis]